MPPKRQVKSATGPEPGPEPEHASEFVGATPGSAMQVVAAEMGERISTLEPPTIYGSDKNPPDKEELNEILAGIHEKYVIPGDKNNGYLEYIKGFLNYDDRDEGTEIEQDILYTNQINHYLYNLLPHQLEQFRLLGPQTRDLLSPADYNREKQVEKAKKQGSESIKVRSSQRKRKHKKRRRSKKRKSKKKKRKTKKKK